MKKIVYTIAILLATGTFANAQSPVLQSEQEIASYTILENDLILFTRKEADGQYIYAERWQDDWNKVIQKETVLNTGTINTVIGKNEAGDELYVYQKNGRNKAVISFYTIKDGNFEKTGERALPRLKNQSQNLGLYLSEDKNVLVISGELGKTRGYDDMYISQWENNRWSKPKNLGSSVNTRQTEFAPFVTADTLYFAREEADKSMVYAVAFAGNAVQAEPHPLDAVVNASQTYNAYYKKQNEQEYWIGKTDENTFAIYKRENPNAYKDLGFDDPLSFEGAVSGSQDPGRIKTDTTAAPEETDDFADMVTHSQDPDMAYKLDAEEAEKSNMVTSSENGLTMHYTLNQVYMGTKQASILNAYLKSLPKGATINVKGFSDGLGSDVAKARVSKKRAQLLRAYIQQNFAAKNLKVVVDSVIKEEVGKHFRIAEIRVVK